MQEVAMQHEIKKSGRVIQTVFFLPLTVFQFLPAERRTNAPT
jgi:hypothetical protein